MLNRGLIPEYEGSTFVGYLDISGFKQMMANNRAKAEDVLDKFYQTIYNSVYGATLNESAPIKFNAIAISDCAVLFLSRLHDASGNNKVDEIEGLSLILKIIQEMNRTFINHSYPFMTTCSIAYGEFHYENRKEIRYLRKNCIRGQANLDAFSDSESNEPRMQPGECRILRKSLKGITLPEDGLLSLVEPDGKHYYFYWMLDNKLGIKGFKLKYKRTQENMYNDLIILIQGSCRSTDLSNRRS
jgi:hypothetical protein